MKEENNIQDVVLKRVTLFDLLCAIRIELESFGPEVITPITSPEREMFWKAQLTPKDAAKLIKYCTLFNQYVYAFLEKVMSNPKNLGFQKVYVPISRAILKNEDIIWELDTIRRKYQVNIEIKTISKAGPLFKRDDFLKPTITVKCQDPRTVKQTLKLFENYWKEFVKHNEKR